MNAIIRVKVGSCCQKERKSKDEVVNAAGKKLLERIQELDLWILNGATDEDSKGEYTQTQRSCTVIDYALTREDQLGP